MVYIICQDWASTSGNHAGMVHLYKEICKNHKKNKLIVVDYKRKKYYIPIKIKIFFIALYLCFVTKKTDKILLTEYLLKSAHQYIIARILRLVHPKCQIDAMVHLVPSIIEKEYTEKTIIKHASIVTRIITLGSSLTTYLRNKGITNIHTSFHYVDLSYYQPVKKTYNSSNKVIIMGALARDFEMLADIVKKTPSLHYYICKGRKNIDYLFDGLHNVTLLGFLLEDELKNYMNMADISLNVMKDTIGSNVICTSMAMGLAMVVSDVGSIHDYCNSDNAIFCSTEYDFINALNNLASKPELVKRMGEKSIDLCQRLSVDKYWEDIK